MLKFFKPLMMVWLAGVFLVPVGREQQRVFGAQEPVVFGVIADNKGGNSASDPPGHSRHRELMEMIKDDGAEAILNLGDMVYPLPRMSWSGLMDDMNAVFGERVDEVMNNYWLAAGGWEEQTINQRYGPREMTEQEWNQAGYAGLYSWPGDEPDNAAGQEFYNQHFGYESRAGQSGEKILDYDNYGDYHVQHRGVNILSLYISDEWHVPSVFGPDDNLPARVSTWDEQVQWFRGRLESIRDVQPHGPIIVMAHDRDWLIQEGTSFRGQLCALMRQFDVDIALCGDGHIYQYWGDATTKKFMVPVCWTGASGSGYFRITIGEETMQLVHRDTYGALLHTFEWAIEPWNDAIPGDANRDGKVDDRDASYLAIYWQYEGHIQIGWAHGDFDGDGNVTDADAAILATHWQEGVEAAPAVPEPSSLVLLGIGALCLVEWLGRRRTQYANNLKQVTLALLLTLLTFGRVTQAQSFHFTVTCDPRENHSGFGDTLQAVNNEVGGPGAFHVTVGDFNYTIAENRDVIDAKLGPSALWYPVIGNHEARPDAGSQIAWLRNEYHNGNGVRAPLKSFTNQDGPAGSVETTYSWDYGDAHFIALNEYWDGGTTPGSDTATDGDIVPALYDWLAADLAANTKPFVFVFGHEPAFPYRRHVGNSLDQYPANRDAFWELLESEGVEAYFCGHTHYYSKHQGDQNHVGKVWQFDAGDSGVTSSEGKTFLDVVVDSDQAVISAYREYGTGTFSLHESVRVPDPGSHSVAYISPIAVVESSPISNPANPPEHVIDGDPETTCNWLDDTPPRIDPEITGHLVVQLDQAYEIHVVNITPRQVGAPINPKGIDFFVFADDDPSNNTSPLDDIEGDPDIMLIEHHEFEPAGLGDPPQVFEFTTPFTATFVGLRITSTNSSYAEWQFTELDFEGELVSERIPGDANEDGKVTDADAAILATNWQQCDAGWSEGDFNEDDCVTDVDAAILATHWQEGVEGAAPVPEPSALVLVGIGALCLAHRFVGRPRHQRR